MDLKVLRQLIAYHQGLDYRHAAQYLEEQTIIALQELEHLEELRTSAQETIKLEGIRAWWSKQHGTSVLEVIAFRLEDESLVVEAWWA